MDVKNLQRSVAGHVILTGLSCQVRDGEVLFFRGASGVGKSLLLRALAYLDPVEVAQPPVPLRKVFRGKFATEIADSWSGGSLDA